MQCTRCGQENPEGVTNCSQCKVNLAFAIANPGLVKGIKPGSPQDKLITKTTAPTSGKKSYLMPALFIAISIACVVLFLVNQANSPSPAPQSVVPAPKVQDTYKVVYKVSGTASKASLTLMTDQGGMEQSDQELPYRKTFNFFKRGQFASLSAQNLGESGSVTCQITVNDNDWKESTSEGAYKIASCSGMVGDR